MFYRDIEKNMFISVPVVKVGAFIAEIEFYVTPFRFKE